MGTQLSVYVLSHGLIEDLAQIRFSPLTVIQLLISAEH